MKQLFGADLSIAVSTEHRKNKMASDLQFRKTPNLGQSIGVIDENHRNHERPYRPYERFKENIS